MFKLYIYRKLTTSLWLITSENKIHMFSMNDLILLSTVLHLKKYSHECYTHDPKKITTNVAVLDMPEDEITPSIAEL